MAHCNRCHQDDLPIISGNPRVGVGLDVVADHVADAQLGHGEAAFPQHSLRRPDQRGSDPEILQAGEDPVSPFSIVRELIQAAFAGEPINAALVTYACSLRSTVRLAALSNTWSFGRTLIRRRGIADLFDLIVTSTEEGIRKPDARVYEISLERLGITSAEAIFIDDNNENVEAARTLGIRSNLFVTNEQTMAELKTLLSLCRGTRG